MYILPHRNAVRAYPSALTGDTGSQSIPNQKIALKTKQAHGVPESKRHITYASAKRGLVRLKQARSTNGMMNHIASMVNNM